MPGITFLRRAGRERFAPEDLRAAKHGEALAHVRAVFLDQSMASSGTPPRHLTFDLDAVDDPAHGHQQLTFWHGYYDQNQYLPLVLT